MRSLFTGLTILSFFMLPAFAIAAMITHIIVCIKTTAYVLLLCGILFFPVGVIHGIGIWFGAW